MGNKCSSHKSNSPWTYPEAYPDVYSCYRQIDQQQQEATNIRQIRQQRQEATSIEPFCSDTDHPEVYPAQDVYPYPFARGIGQYEQQQEATSIEPFTDLASNPEFESTTDREEGDQEVKLEVTLTPSSLIKEDDKNPIYVLHIGKWRCEVKKCSTLHFVAVRSKDNKWSKFPPHCGLMLKNKFYLQERDGDEKHEFDYLLAHALLMDTDSASTKLILSFYNSQKMVFTELRSVHKAYKQATESISPGVISSTPCNQLVELVKEELAKPFDPNWSKHLEGASRPSNSVTNCALLAG